MSVKHGLLALLQRGSRYGYQLRTEFEHATGGTWPLNIGQVYTTLTRLERDGLVRALPESDGGQRPYEITEEGRVEVALWFASPISQNDRPRDELAIKLALALTTPGVDVRAVVQTQRTGTMRMLQEYPAQVDRGGRRRPRLAAGARRHGVPGRGRGPLARPLRVEPGPLRAGRRGHHTEDEDAQPSTRD